MCDKWNPIFGRVVSDQETSTIGSLAHVKFSPGRKQIHEPNLHMLLLRSTGCDLGLAIMSMVWTLEVVDRATKR